MIKRFINRETFAYLICGLITTFTNIIAFDVLNKQLGEENIFWSETIAFIIAVSIAYILNKCIVFQKNDWTFKTVIKEASKFFGCRITSYIVDFILILLARDVLHAGQYTILSINGLTIAKIPINIIVIILNYIFSKVFVFTNKKHPS